MPVVRVSPRKGKPVGDRRAILEGIYVAMRQTFDVPEYDQFMTISEHEPENFSVDPISGIARTDAVVLIQITANTTRSVAQKQALYRRTADRLAEDPGLMPHDVFINLVEVAKENWSFGEDVAQYA